MLIPWGHDSSQIRRRPWVTYGVAVACVIAFVAISTVPTRPWEDANLKLEEAFDFWQSHPYLDGNDRLVSEYWALDDEDYIAWVDENGGYVPDALTIEAEQADLAVLMVEERELRAEDPWMRFGLVPLRPTATGLFGHMFLHGGWLHLLGNLWFLILSGPYIEDRFGRGMFAMFYLASGLAGAALFAGMDGGEAPLIGASGAVSGVLGAFLVCSMRIRIKFFYWVIWPGTFSAPAWVMLPLWFASELASAMSAPQGDPVAYWAHVGGFGFGAIAALAIRRLGVEGMVSSDLGELEHESGSPVLDATRIAIRDGRMEEAIAGANDALAEGEADPAAVRAYLEAVHAAGRERDVVPTLIEHLWSAIEWRKKEAAIALWDALAEQKVTPAGRGEPLAQLASWLRGASKASEANVAMRAALQTADSALAVRIARAARRHDPVLVMRAAEMALAAPELAPGDHKAMRALREEAEQEARRRGWLVLAADERVEKSRGRSATVVATPPATPTAHIERAGDYEDEILGGGDDAAGTDLFDAKVAAVPDDDEALDLSGLGASDYEDTAYANAQTVAAAPSALAPGEAIDISDILGDDDEAPVKLADPEAAGGEAFLDSLHAALESEGLSDRDLLEVTGSELSDEPGAVDLGAVDGTLFEAAGVDLAADPEVAEPSTLSSPLAAPTTSEPGSSLGGEGAALLAPAVSPPPPEPMPTTAQESESFEADFLVLDAEKEEVSPPRRLQVMSAVPLGIDATHVTLDVEGRGRSRLSFDRIDAVSTAGVNGLSEAGKPVLIIDLCLNWTGHDDLQVVRLRSDGFDPRRLVDADGSPLKALRALASLLVMRCRGVSLPPEAEPDAPFRIYSDPDTYQLEVLRAVR